MQYFDKVEELMCDNQFQYIMDIKDENATLKKELDVLRKETQAE